MGLLSLGVIAFSVNTQVMQGTKGQISFCMFSDTHQKYQGEPVQSHTRLGLLGECV